MMSAHRTFGIDKAVQNKGLRTKNVHGSLTPVASANVNDDIKQAIRASTHSKQILKLMKQRKHEIQDASIYGKAMAKCNNSFRDYQTTHDLWIELLRSGLPIVDMVQFTIFANGMSAFDHQDAIHKYFKLMLRKYKQSPTVVTLAVLIKSCRYRCMWQRALKYWKLLEIYHIEPNEIVYTEMITVLGKSVKTQLAAQIFNEYQQLVLDKKLKAHLPAYTANLNIYARSGDVDGLQKAYRLIQQRFGRGHINKNAVIYGVLMNGYIRAKHLEQAIDAFDEMLANGTKPGQTHLFLKIVALFQILNRDKDILSLQEKLALYQQIHDNIHQQCPFYGVEVTAKTACIGLGAAIVTYCEEDPMEIVKLFQELYEQKLIAYCVPVKGKAVGIDLHGFCLWEAQFILRYVLAFEIEHIVHENQRNGHDTVSIVVGAGLHSQKKTEQQQRYRYPMKQFIVDELLKYDPPIHATPNAHNDGQLLVKMEELEPYMQVENNDAFRKLQKETCNANDWFLNTVRIDWWCPLE